MNKAPDWVKGTFVWRINLPEESNSLQYAEAAIASVGNRCDGAIRQNVFVNGAIGADKTCLPWDGIWPYWSRLSYRVNHDWKYLSHFMLKMRDRHNAWISFHVNITDVNVGLAHYPETRKFFEVLRDNKCIFRREKGVCDQPWWGEAYVPQKVPTDKNTMDMPVNEAADIFALVDYKQLWDTGIARQIIDDFYAHLPYAPPVLYVDVLNTKGWCIHPGYPDGTLGHSLATQIEGRRNICEYIRSKGSEVGAEVPGTMFDIDSTYSWGHGGLATNDYSRIGSSYGGTEKRENKGSHVYGNQGGFHHACKGEMPEFMKKFETFEDGGRSKDVDRLRTWGTISDICSEFYLSVIQELYHIGKGNCRLPGGNTCARLDEQNGKIILDRILLRKGSVELVANGAEGALTGSCAVKDEANAYCGKVVVGMHHAALSGCALTIMAPEAGRYDMIVRYAATGRDGIVALDINGTFAGNLRCPCGERIDLFNDLLVPVDLQKGENTIALYHGGIFAEWTDGSKAKWDRDGFKAWNGDVVFGEGFNRMWPDSWSGRKRIFLFSYDGCSRKWRLPQDWVGIGKARLYELGDEGRENETDVTIVNNEFRVKLRALVPCVLVP